MFKKNQFVEISNETLVMALRIIKKSTKIVYYLIFCGHHVTVSLNSLQCIDLNLVGSSLILNSVSPASTMLLLEYLYEAAPLELVVVVSEYENEIWLCKSFTRCRGSK